MGIFRKAIFGAAVAALTGFGALSAAQATVLTFDDLPSGTTPVPDGYGGFTWNNNVTVGVVNAPNDGLAGSGYQNGTVSAPNVAFNYYGLSPVDIRSVGATPFTFNGADFTSAWSDQNVSFVGLLGGNVVDTSGLFAINTQSPIFISLNWADIDELQIFNDGSQWAMDNFTFNEAITNVPAPLSLVLLATGLAGLGGLRRRKVAPAV